MIKMALELPKSNCYTERIFRDYRDGFTILWIPDSRCNFKCEYDYGPTFKCVDYDMNRFIKEIGKIKPYRVAITGGETLMVSNIIEICQRLGKLGIILEIQTNFSINAKEFVDATSSEYVEVLLMSYHAKERKIRIKDGIKKFIDDVSYAKKKGFTIQIFYIDYPGIPVEEFMNSCRVLYEGTGIIPMRKRYLGNVNGGFLGDTLHLKGRRCRAGYKFFCLWNDFSMSPCEADRSNLGNLFTGYELFKEAYVCPMEHCGCLGRELVIDEFYDDYYKRKYGG